MRVEPSNARAQAQAAAPKAAERKPKPELQKTTEQPARPEVAKPSQQDIKNNRIDVRAWTGFDACVKFYKIPSEQKIAVCYV